MKMRKVLIVLMLVLAVVACKREEPKPIPGAAGPGAVDFDREISLLKSILKEDPDNLQALVKLGNISYDVNRCQDAVDAYGRALELSPDNVNVRVDMGTCYRKLGRSDRAMEEYRKAIEINPNHQYAHMNMAVVLAYDFNKKDEAIKEFEKYLELAPTAPNAQFVKDEIAKLKAAK
jgi:tetratricopeptide (TPR) repeat protein